MRKLLTLSFVIILSFSFFLPVSAAKSTPSSAGNNYLIVLDNKSLTETIKEFVKFKTSEGHKITVITAADIKSKGSDDAEKLRNYLIAQEKKLNLEYVLLIGDPFIQKNANPQETGGNIPMKYLYDNKSIHKVKYTSEVYKPRSDGFCDESGNIPSDLYYVMDINWDANKNGFAGEYMEDVSIKKTSLKSMFKLGRIPFNDPETVAKVLKNSMEKEKACKTKSGPFSALIAAGIIGFNQSGMIDSAAFTEKLKASLLKNKYKVTTLYEKEGVRISKYASTVALSRENFKNEWAKGYDFVCTDAHDGSRRYIWKEDANGNGIPDDHTSPGLCFEEFFAESDLQDKIGGFFVMSGCSTASMESDRGTLEYPQIPALLANGYIFAGVGTTKTIGYNIGSLSYSLCSSWDQSGKTYGDCYYKSIESMFKSFKIDHFDFYHNLYSYSYFGDPSFKNYAVAAGSTKHSTSSTGQ